MAVTAPDAAGPPLVITVPGEGVVTVHTVDDAQGLLERLGLEIKDIQYQLGEGRRKHPVEDRDLDEAEYASWRRKALKALLFKQRQLVDVRQWMRAKMHVHETTRELLRDGLRLMEEHVPMATDAARLWMRAVERHLSVEPV